jgi:hypothetical protein
MRFSAPLAALLLSLSAGASLHAQGAMPGAMSVAPSGRATTEVVLTLVDSAARAASQPSRIRIDYGQPHLRGRRLLTDSLVPFDQPWRLGANNPTTLTTDVDLVVGGATIPKGTWILQAFPSRAGWKLLVQRNVPATAAAAQAPYDPANDFARIDLRQVTLPIALESLTIWLIPARDSGTPRGELRLAWGTIALATDWSVK